MDDNEKLESIAKEKRQKFSVWLVENNLLDYASAFEEEGFNDLAVLAELSDAEVEELASGLRMKMGHKKKLPIAIRNLKKMKEKEQRQEQQREQEKEKDRRLQREQQREQGEEEDAAFLIPSSAMLICRSDKSAIRNCGRALTACLLLRQYSHWRYEA